MSQFQKDIDKLIQMELKSYEAKNNMQKIVKSVIPQTQLEQLIEDALNYSDSIGSK